MKSSVLGHYDETSLSIVYRKSILLARLARPACLADLASECLAVLDRLRLSRSSGQLNGINQRNQMVEMRQIDRFPAPRREMLICKI